jgi:vanillate O-demethylase ferredoxin subunit
MNSTVNLTTRPQSAVGDAPDGFAVRVVQMRYEAPTVLSMELAHPDGAELPPFTAGAHIDLRLAPDCTRSYSLLNNSSERHRYVVAVHFDPESRGGSRHVHERLRVGDLLAITAPDNHFPLDENAAHSILIAGGIGITPLLSMARRLNELGRPWDMFYAARSRRSAAFVRDLEDTSGAGAGRLHLYFDDESGGGAPDLSRIVAAAQPDSHFYCCGPAPMLDAFRRLMQDVAPVRVHFEYFAAAQEAATEGDFELVLAKSGKRVEVPAGKTLLQAIIDAKVDVNYACSQGVCGTCLTTVLEGEPDHRDNYLTDEERASNSMIMVCCSGSKSARIVLDL